MSDGLAGSKVCSKCGRTLDCSLFTVNKTSKDGLRSSCKECQRETQAKYREANRDKLRDRQLQARFGITVEEFNLILEGQGGRCAICRKPASVFSTNLAVDHDHSSGMVRGILCSHCNLRVLGKLTVTQVDNILEYLLNPPAQRVIGDRIVPTKKAKRRKRKARTRSSTTRSPRRAGATRPAVQPLAAD
jgi:hypothetical protein